MPRLQETRSRSEMMILCGQSNGEWHRWSATAPNRVGVLVSPQYHRKLKMRKYMPYALDNGAWISFVKKEPYPVDQWREMLRWARMTGIKPLWCLVPDVVADKKATLVNWYRYAPEAAEYGWPLAFAAQDGMTPSDVPEGVSVVFIGGSDAFKYRCLPAFCAAFPRVHVGRVNEVDALQICKRMGCESADGSGWFKDTRRLSALEAWIHDDLEETPELPMASWRSNEKLTDSRRP
jgi:hypothetical protein